MALGVPLNTMICADCGDVEPAEVSVEEVDRLWDHALELAREERESFKEITIELDREDNVGSR